MACKIIQLQNKSGENIHQTHRNMLNREKELRETYIDRASRSKSALWTCASKGRLLECILILPAINEVTMQPIACRVTHSIDPFVKIGEGRGIVVEFVEDRIDGNRVRLRTDSAVVSADSWEGHLWMRSSVNIHFEYARLAQLTWLE